MDKISEIFNFDNIGSKIKNLAKWSCWITILLIWIAAPISFFVLVAGGWTAEFCLIPLVGAIVGPILVWIGSWAMYAFGEFVEDVHAIRDKEKTTNKVNIGQETGNNAIRNKTGTTKGANVRRETVSKTTYNKAGTTKEANSKSTHKKRSETEEKVIREARIKSSKYDCDFMISISGKGYICPVCKTSNDSFEPCEECFYVPPISSADEIEFVGDYIDVICPSCKEELSFLTEETTAVCPFCNKTISLK